MKKVLAFGLVALLSLWSSFAGDDHSAPEYSAVQGYDFDLEIENEGGKVTFEWEKFSRDEKIKWWKLVYSQSSEDISYPENDARYLGNAQDKTSATQWFDAGMYYFRLCAITEQNNRYCSEVEKFSFEQETKKYDSKKEHAKEYAKVKNNAICTREYAPVCGKTSYGMKTYSNKCVMESQGASFVSEGKCEKSERAEKMYKKKEAMKKRKTILSEKVKGKIDTMLDSFLERLEKKGYSDEQMLSKINTVMERLKKLESNKKYTFIVRYMMEVLEDEKMKYDSELNEVEKVFEGL